MSQKRISQSPLNIRRINFAIAEGILRTLETSDNHMEAELLVSEGLQRAQKLDPTINDRTTKCSETLMELRRMGLIDLSRIFNKTIYTLLDEGRNALLKIDTIDRDIYFFHLLYEKEPLFKQYVDMLQRKGKMETKEGFAISGMNSVKMSFIKSILRQAPSIARFRRDNGKNLVEYIAAFCPSVSDIRQIIVQIYDRLRGDRLFVRIDELWQSIRQKYPNISEESFDKAIFDLVADYMGKIELQQGVSPPEAKLIFDTRSETYFHYLKIPIDVLDAERKNER